MPFEDGSNLGITWSTIHHFAANGLQTIAGEVVLKKQNAFLGGRKHLTLGLLGLIVGSGLVDEWLIPARVRQLHRCSFLEEALVGIRLVEARGVHVEHRLRHQRHRTASFGRIDAASTGLLMFGW